MPDPRAHVHPCRKTEDWQAALEIEEHTLVRQVEHALARRRFKGATKPKRS
jgi:hypothetical protein